MRVILAFLLSFICGAAVAQDGSLRRLSLDPRTVIEKQAGDHVHGYVCSKGGDMWSNDELLVHLDSFLAALEERKVVFQKIDPASNFAGGNGIFHAFILWATLKNVRPTLIVESGVFKGGSSWLIHKATEEWNPILVFVGKYVFVYPLRLSESHCLCISNTPFPSSSLQIQIRLGGTRRKVPLILFMTFAARIISKTLLQSNGIKFKLIVQMHWCSLMITWTKSDA